MSDEVRKLIAELRAVLAPLSDDDRKEALTSLFEGWCIACGSKYGDRYTCHCEDDS